MTTSDTGGTGETVVSAIGGMVIGYVLWLIAISIGNDITTVSQWSLIVLLGSIVLAVCAGVWGWWMRRRGQHLGAAFAFGLPILPVLLTLAVLTNIYI
jgi:hypothetical protein